MEHQCNCGSSHSTAELGVQYNLFEKIDTTGAECLNESEDGAGIKVFKPWEERLNHDKFVESDVDDELLFNIPFTGNVKLKGIIIIGGPEGSHPAKVKLFKNKEHMTFDDVGITPDQEFELVKDDHGVHEYPIKVVKFSSVHHLSLHFVGNSGAETTRIDYIGLKGEWTPGHRHGVTICNYEAFPMGSDNALKDLNNFSREVQ
ncbi:PITH domain-containing protein CG6153 [Diachasma alloeum]|uniref:PITH domain-containing protein CG6153 n=1 Tax=Diachasma alloeum TaxID=454923 RepID=UPI0007381086|nr:PITH domain-containing protein CG6153 [Diachasma alloeum]XP_015114154.1 PITH domain-containing protein CG6153 [Diachasma alloeum]